MKKKVLSYVALSSALLTAAPLLGNVTANAATTNNNTTSSSAKVSNSSSSAKESSRVSASVKSSSATSSSKVADKKTARSAVRANNFAVTDDIDVHEPANQKNVGSILNMDKNVNLNSQEKADLTNAVAHNNTVVPNVYGKGFTVFYGYNSPVNGVLEYNGQPFTGYDAQDGVFWYQGFPYTLTQLQQAGIKVPQSVVNAMKQAAAKNKANNGTVRLANGQTIRTYGYNHYVANVNARTLPKTGESNSIISLLKALF